MQLPAEMKGPAASTPFGVEWNKLVRYLRSIRPVAGAGVTISQSPFGTTTSTVRKSGAGVPMCVKVCRTDGSTCYLEVLTTGRVFAVNTGDATEPTIDAGSVPDGAKLLE